MICGFVIHETVVHPAIRCRSSQSEEVDRIVVTDRPQLIVETEATGPVFHPAAPRHQAAVLPSTCVTVTLVPSLAGSNMNVHVGISAKKWDLRDDALTGDDLGVLDTAFQMEAQ